MAARAPQPPSTTQEWATLPHRPTVNSATAYPGPLAGSVAQLTGSCGGCPELEGQDAMPQAPPSIIAPRG